MTDRIHIGHSGPSTDFYLEADLLSQSVSSNTSVVRCYLRCVNGGSGSTGSQDGNSGWQQGSIDGIGVFRKHSGNPFLPSGYSAGATRWREGPYDVTVPHNADGTKSITLRMQLYYGDNVTASMSLPTIARATQPSLSAASVNAGSPVTINTPRASTAFTHTLRYAYGSMSGTIATGVATSQVWTPPMNLLTQIPNGATGTGTIYCDTYSGASLIGTKAINIAIAAGPEIIPTIGGLTHAETVADVASKVGAYVQSQSALALAITGAAGVYGSTVTGYRLTVAGQTIDADSGTTDPIGVSGSVPVVATVTDSRGRTASQTVNINVLPWVAPTVWLCDVDRCTSAGVADPNGTYLLVRLNAAVASLMNGAEKNALTYTVSTRVTGSSTFVTKATVTPGGVAFNATFKVGTGGEFSIGSSYDVQVVVSDRFGQVPAYRTVTTAQVPLDVARTGIGVGKVWEHGALDVEGDSYLAGRLFGADLEPSLPARLRSPGKDMSNGDWNNATDSGWYYGTQVANRPPSGGADWWHWVQVYRHADYGWIQQVAYEYFDTRVWQRKFLYGTTWSEWQLIADGTPLPAPLRATASSTSNTITSATQFGQSVPFTNNSITIPPNRRLWVTVNVGAWLIASAGDTRAGIRCTGATNMVPPVDQGGNWGMVLLLVAATSTSSVQSSIQRTILLEPGTTTFDIVAYQTGGGNHQINYPVLEVVPLRWA